MFETVVGLVGASGSGKSMLADMLVEDYGFTKLHIGTPLKGMLRVLGLSEYDVSGPPDHRSKAHELLSDKSVRFALSTLGTQWGREMIGEDLWSKNLQRRVAQHFHSNSGVGSLVVDDLRFPNDWDAITKLGGYIVTVRRPEAEIPRSLLDMLYYKHGLKKVLSAKALSRYLTHETEFHWRDAPKAFEVHNSASPKELTAAFVDGLQSLTEST